MLEPLFLQSTNTLVCPANFYPLDIRVPHHQLRNFISASYDDRIYYIHRYDIFILDLVTCERSLVATVPFEARCLTAAHGWICVGGERTGDCAFAYIGEEDGRPGDVCQELHVKTIGTEIVNAISIEILKPDLDTQAEELVVLLSNNDRTVTIYSLARWEVLAVLDHPYPMNNARLSPDSTILAAIGDENKVFFRKRFQIHAEDENEEGYPNYGWRSLGTPTLPQGSIEVSEDYSFAVAFSPDGSLCAVSSKSGCISVFDMDIIEEEDLSPDEAMLCTFRSSRPGQYGCVRSMHFSPGHWGLLAWSEDHKNIGIADVRQAFQRRQHISLLPDSFRRQKLIDVDADQWLQTKPEYRLRQQAKQREQPSRGQPPIGARSLRVDRPPLSPDPSESDSPGFVASHEAMLRALDIHGDRPESARLPYSINYNSRPPAVASSASNTPTRREWDVQLLNPSYRAPNTPQRRSSVVLSHPQPSTRLHLPGDTTRMMMTASPGMMSDDDLPPLMSTNDLTPSATAASQPLPYNIPASDPWHVIEADLHARRSNPDRQNISDQIQAVVFIERLNAAISAETRFNDQLQEQLETERQIAVRFDQNWITHERTVRVRMNDDSANISELDHTHLQRLQDQRESSQQRIQELELSRRNLLSRWTSLTTERSLQTSRSQGGTTLLSDTSSTRRSEDEALTHRLQRMVLDREQRMRRFHELQIEASSAQHDLDFMEAALIQVAPTRTSQVEPTNSTSTIPLATTPPTDIRRQLDTQSTSALIQRWRPSTPDTMIGSVRATLPRTSNIVTRTFNIRRTANDSNGNWSGPGSVSQPAEQQAFVEEHGFGTAGIAWSPDGLKLFAALQQGIFELDLNIQDRLQSPLIEWR